ncbi:MAG: hypothetical protein OYG31_01115 [Candidatus Kaiserbacteria bacterium]|nr:hypothetical protein [Candidatus Kaiserbacteria bacterium]
MSNYFVKALILLLFSAIAYAVFIGPWYAEARATYDHVQHLEDVISQVQELGERRDELQAEFNSIPPNKTALIQNAVPPHSSENVILFFLSLDAFITQSGLPTDTAYTIDPEEVNPDTGMVAIPIQFNFEVIDYDLFRRIIDNFQRWERAVQITSVHMWPSSSDQFGNTIRASIEIEALFSAGLSSENI